VAVSCINGVAALTGFSYKKKYGHFAGTKKGGRNNEVTIRRVPLNCLYKERLRRNVGAKHRNPRKTQSKTQYRNEINE